MIAKTPEVPCYAVIFTSIRNEFQEEYDEMASKTEKLVEGQPIFLGF